MYPIHPWILYCVKHSLLAVSDITRVCMATENVSLMGLYLFPKGEINMDSSDQRPSCEYYTLTDASQGRL